MFLYFLFDIKKWSEIMPKHFCDNFSCKKNASTDMLAFFEIFI
jgi:hypothetical protein